MPNITEIEQETAPTSSPMPTGIQHLPNSASVAAKSLSGTLDEATKVLYHMNEERKRAAFQRYNYIFEGCAEKLEQDYAKASDYSNFDSLRTEAFKYFQNQIKDEEFAKAYMNQYGSGLDSALKVNMNKNKAKKEVTLYNIELDKTLTSTATMAATAPNLDERNRHLTEAKLLIGNSSFLSPEDKAKTLSNFEELVKSAKNTAMENLIYNDLPRAEEAQKNNFFGFDGETLSSYNTKIAAAKKEDNISQKLRVNEDIKLEYDNIRSFWNNGEPIPAEVISGISDRKMQEGIKAKDFARKQGGDVATNANLYYRLEGMAKNSPAAFKTYNLYQHVGELADDDLSTLETKQANIYLSKDGKPYSAPERTVDATLKNAIFKELGIGNPDEKLMLEKQLRASIREAENKKGSELSLSEQDEISKQFTTSVNMRGLFSSDKEVWRIDNKNMDDVYLDYDDIDDKTKDAITNSLKKASIDLTRFTEDEQEKLCEDIAGALRLPAKLKSERIRTIFKDAKQRSLGKISSNKNTF